MTQEFSDRKFAQLLAVGMVTSTIGDQQLEQGLERVGKTELSTSKSTGASAIMNSGLMIPGVDGSEMRRLSGGGVSLLLPEEPEERLAAEGAKDNEVKDGEATMLVETQGVAERNTQSNPGSTDHSNPSCTELESVYEDTLSCLDFEGSDPFDEICCSESNDDKFDVNEIEENYDSLDFQPKYDDFDLFKPTSPAKPKISTTPATQKRKIEDLDNEELFSQFINTLNGGGRLGSYQESWLCSHLANIRASKGHGAEYMYLLELVLSLQEQLKVTWDREDRKFEVMEESWLRMDKKGGEREKKEVEMLNVVMGCGWERKDFLTVGGGRLDFKRLGKKAGALLALQRDLREREREGDFFAFRRAVGDGLREKKVDAPWFPTEEAIGRLIYECFRERALAESTSLGRFFGVFGAVEEIFQQYKDHTAPLDF